MPHPEPAQRGVRSFVRREGRITAAQKRALTELWGRYGMSLDAIALQPVTSFPNPAPLHLEIGCGNGESLVALASRYRENNYLGCDVYRPGLGHALLEIHKRHLLNVRLAACDAVDLIRTLPARTLDAVYILFPDPWPKKRHHKRRLLQRGFLNLLCSRVKLAGTVLIATDLEGYGRAILDTVSSMDSCINLAGPGSWAPPARVRGVTRFEARAHAAGRTLFEIALAPVSTARHELTE